MRQRLEALASAFSVLRRPMTRFAGHACPRHWASHNRTRANRGALETPATRNVAPASRLSKPLSETDMSLLDTFHPQDDSPVCHLTLFRGLLSRAAGMRPSAYVYMRHCRSSIPRSATGQHASLRYSHAFLRCRGRPAILLVFLRYRLKRTKVGT